MKEYDVVGRYGLVKLVRAVNDLDDNWECQGGILALSEPDNATLYLQAMVREVKDSFTEEDFENARTRARALQEEMGWRAKFAAELVICPDNECPERHNDDPCPHSVPHTHDDVLCAAGGDTCPACVPVSEVVDSAADLVVCSDTRCVHHGNGTCERSVPHVYTDECKKTEPYRVCKPVSEIPNHTDLAGLDGGPGYEYSVKPTDDDTIPSRPIDSANGYYYLYPSEEALVKAWAGESGESPRVVLSGLIWGEKIRRKGECTPDPPGHGACGDLSTPIDLESAVELRRLAASDGFTIPMELRRLIWDEVHRRASLESQDHVC